MRATGADVEAQRALNALGVDPLVWSRIDVCRSVVLLADRSGSGIAAAAAVVAASLAGFAG